MTEAQIMWGINTLLLVVLWYMIRTRAETLKLIFYNLSDFPAVTA